MRLIILVNLRIDQIWSSKNVLCLRSKNTKSDFLIHFVKKSFQGCLDIKARKWIFNPGKLSSTFRNPHIGGPVSLPCTHKTMFITCFLTNSAMYFLIGLAICSSSKTAPPFMPWRAAASCVAMWKNSCMDCRRFRKNKGESRLWASLFQGDNCAMKRTQVKSSQVKSSSSIQQEG